MTPTNFPWASVLGVTLVISACGDDGSSDAGDAAEGSTSTSDASGTTGSSQGSTGSGGTTGDGSTTGAASMGADVTGGSDTGSEATNCDYGEGPGGLTYSVQLDDPVAQLLTEADRPDTGEVYCITASQGGSPPVVMVPGLGLSHYIYLTTPDRRDGWASLFAAAGMTAHVLNPRRNILPADDPSPPDTASIWLEDDFWDRWGFGPQPPDPYPDVRFPVAEMEDFTAHLPYYGPGPGGTGVSQSEVDELTELLEQVGPAVLVAHSAAGPASFQVALDRPELVAAMVVLEPTGCPEEAAAVPDVPFLAVYGDYIASRGQSGRMAACQATADLAQAAGQPSDLFSYPAMDIFGNTHLLMQDDNNDEIAADVIAWLESSL